VEHLRARLAAAVRAQGEAEARADAAERQLHLGEAAMQAIEKKASSTAAASATASPGISGPLQTCHSSSQPNYKETGTLMC
jgi:hypothetical protein